jgi:hypothetical protein
MERMGIDDLNKQLDQEIGRVCAKWDFTKISMNHAVNRQLSASMAQANGKNIVDQMFFKLKLVNDRYLPHEIRKLQKECDLLQGPANFFHFIEVLNIDASVDEQKDAYLRRLQRSAPPLAERGTTLVPDRPAIVSGGSRSPFGSIDLYAEQENLSLNDAIAFVERAKFKLSIDWKISVSNDEMASLVEGAIECGETIEQRLPEFKKWFDSRHSEELARIQAASVASSTYGRFDPSTKAQDVTDSGHGSSPFKKFIESARRHMWYGIGAGAVVVIGALTAVGAYWYFGKKKKEEAPHHA